MAAFAVAVPIVTEGTWRRDETHIETLLMQKQML